MYNNIKKQLIEASTQLKASNILPQDEPDDQNIPSIDNEPICPPSVDPEVWNSLPQSIRSELLQSLPPSPPRPPKSLKRSTARPLEIKGTSSHDILKIPYIDAIRRRGQLIMRPPITRPRTLGGGGEAKAGAKRQQKQYTTFLHN